MAITHDLLAGGESYVGKDGKERRKWIRCGVVVETKNGGQAIKLETIPVNFDGWLQMKEPFPKDSQQTSAKSSTSFDDIESDVPF